MSILCSYRVSREEKKVLEKKVGKIKSNNYSFLYLTATLNFTPYSYRNIAYRLSREEKELKKKEDRKTKAITFYITNVTK